MTKTKQVSRQNKEFSVRLEKKIKVQTKSQKNKVYFYFYYSFPIASFCRFAPKITVKYKFVVFPSPFSVLMSLVCVVTKTIVCIQEQSDPPCRLSREHLPIMTPIFVVWVPRCVIFRFEIFIVCNILWRDQTLEWFKICAPVTDVTNYSLGKKTDKRATKNV